MDEKLYKIEKLPEIKVLTRKQRLARIDQTIIISADIDYDYIYEKC